MIEGHPRYEKTPFPFLFPGMAMPPFVNKILCIFAILCIQILIYGFWVRPLITTWGATGEEARMPLPGDELAYSISSTRAITIQASSEKVWDCLIRLGADRGGFFSYSFIEELLGYEKDGNGTDDSTNLTFEVGRVIPASMDESKSFIKYRFPVVYVEKGKAFVLENWGTFFLEQMDRDPTRLIVRTHWKETPTLASKIGEFIEVPMHYLMERRMLMGIQMQVEDEDALKDQYTRDRIWFAGVLLSGVGIFLLICVSKGIQDLWLPSFLAIAWLWPLLVLDPEPLPPMILLLLVLAALGGKLRKRNRGRNPATIQ